MEPKLGLIVAATPQGHIGYKNGIPWVLKGDLANFKSLTLGQVVIMGSNTYESLPNAPLPNRVNIVVGKRYHGHSGFLDEDLGLYTAPTLGDAIELAKRFATDWIYFIGGVRIYEEALPLVEVAHVTLVHKQGEYDTQINNLNFPVSLWSLDSNHVTVFDTDPEIGLPIPSHTYLTYRRK